MPPATFWNLSNHPSAQGWPPDQAAAARAWGGPDHPRCLRDIPFPPVDPQAPVEAVVALAERTLADLLAAGAQPGEPILVMGEFTLVVALVPRLQARGLIPLATTTLRASEETTQPDGSVTKRQCFRFVAFRPYPPVRI